MTDEPQALEINVTVRVGGHRERSLEKVSGQLLQHMVMHALGMVDASAFSGAITIGQSDEKGLPATVGPETNMVVVVISDKNKWDSVNAALGEPDLGPEDFRGPQ